MGSLAGVPTQLAKEYQEGCFGLVQIRLDLFPYSRSNHFFTELEDAKKLANRIGPRIFAIQFNGPLDFPRIRKEFASEVGVPPAIHNNGNHATWHQGFYGNFWEWSGPFGWNSYPFDAPPADRVVKHRSNLPASYQQDRGDVYQTGAPYAWTVYGVAVVPGSNPFRPPLIGPAQPTAAPSAE